MPLFRRKRRRAQPTTMRAIYFEDDGSLELVAAVGEANYQPALHRLCGRRGVEAIRFPCVAALFPEPDNRYDPNAVMVQVDGQHVGYLCREDAVAYREAVLAAAEYQHVIACPAMIAGRGPEDPEHETSNLGIFLHLPEPLEAEAQVAEHFGAEPV